MEPIILSAILPTIIGGAVNIINGLISSSTQRDINNERIAEQKTLQEQSLQLQELHHKERILAQYLEGEANRQTQTDIAKTNVIASHFRDELNRKTQTDIANANILASHFRDELNREFQERMKLLDIGQYELNREHALKLEQLRTDFQRWVIGRQRNLQLEIKSREEKLARELAAYNRETQLKNIEFQIRENKRISRLPTWVDLQSILGRKQKETLQTLHVFFSPPTIKKDGGLNPSSFPNVSYNVEINLDNFLRLYKENQRPVNFMSGAWDSKIFYGKAAAEAFFSELKSEPTVILESTVESGNYFVNLASWVDNSIEPNFNNLLSFSWQKLFDEIKKRNKDEAEQTFVKYLSVLNAIFIGFRIDEYYLLCTEPQNRQKPLLPELLPELLRGISETESHLIAEILKPCYQKLYEKIARTESAWLPEIRLQFANTLIALSHFELAEQELISSLKSFLQFYLTGQKIPDSLNEMFSLLPMAVSKSEEQYLHDFYKLFSKFSDKQKTELTQLEVYMEDRNRLAVRMLDKAKLIRKDNPSVYRLLLNEELTNSKQMLAKSHIGEPDINQPVEKVLMILGAAGAGKTTLINGMINYIMGVEWKDDFRFQLITEETKKSQAHSQTQFITAYTVHKMQGSVLPYNLTIIDTPGFGATEGLQRDKFITDQIREFFSMPNGIRHLDGIGFVTQSSLARLTPTQKYVFDTILSIFGKDIASNIFMMITFCDGQKPPVIEAVKSADIPYTKFFKFNNSALFANNLTSDDKNDEDDEDFDKMFWKMGTKSFKTFFNDFAKAETQSLRLTKEVLHERKQLETTILGLEPRISEGLSKLHELRQLEIVIQQRKQEIEHNKNFKFTVSVPKQRRLNAPRGEYNTTCMQCHITCHHNCAFAHDEEKKNCSAMKSNGYCNVCGCHWSKHSNTPYIFETYTDTETKTSDELLRKYNTAVAGKNKAESMLSNLAKEFESVAEDVFLMIMQVQQSLHRLDKIALKPDPLTSLEYLDLLIESEKRDKKEGWRQRIDSYEAFKKQAKLLDVDNNKDIKEILSSRNRIKENKNKIKMDFSGLLKSLKFW